VWNPFKSRNRATPDQLLEARLALWKGYCTEEWDQALLRSGTGLSERRSSRMMNNASLLLQNLKFHR